MNKYLILGIVGVVIIGGAFLYSVFLRPSENAPCPLTGAVKEFTVTAVKDRWLFAPEEITVECGDNVVMTVVNEDDYDHGIGIDAFGISERMPANATIKVEFSATKAGEFPFYCSVPCGQCESLACEVDGVRLGHFDMIGKLHVRSLTSGTQ